MTTSPNTHEHAPPVHSTSELGDLTILEFEHPEAPTRHVEHEAHLREIGTADDNPSVPKSTLVVVAETEKLHEDVSKEEKKSGHNLVASLTDFDFAFSKIKATNWSPDSGKFYSDYIKEGLEYKQQDSSKTIMLFEGPSSSTSNTSFHNKDKYRFHDWPPPKSSTSKSILGPCKYASTNGSAFPVFLRGGAPPPGLTEHWARAIPGIADHLPTFVDKVTEDDLVYAYLPVEQIKNHVNDPAVHYHLCGKDAIHLMTQMTTKLLPDTRTSRPCVVKTTHSMGSKGIFIIQNDEDEKEFEQFLEDSGHPTFVVTDFVDIHRNVACHLFIHPDGESVTWFGSNENKRLPNGTFSSDSYLYMDDQEKLKRMQLPFVEEVVQYCKSLNFWGFLGIDVLFNTAGRGYLVDINPRVTGSSPALITLQILKKTYGFTCGLFRRTGDINFYGTAQQLLDKAEAYNVEHEGTSRVVIHSFYEAIPGKQMRMNIGVYGMDMDECKTVLNDFAVPKEDPSHHDD